MEKMNLKFGKKYIKHILKEIFDKRSLRRLKINYSSDIFLSTNLFNIGGFYFKIFLTFSDNEYKANFLIYDYYGDNHTYMKNITVTGINSLLNYDKKGYHNYMKEDVENLSDRIISIPYSKELLKNYIEYLSYIKDNLNLGKTYYYGDGRGSDRLVLKYKNNSVIVQQGNCSIDLLDIGTYSKEELVERINNIRNIDIMEDVEFILPKNKNYEKGNTII